MKKCLIAMMVLLMFLSGGCTEKERARNFGGKVEMTVPKDKQLVNVTWKEGPSLWLLTTDREPGHQPKTYYFEEDSSFGIFEGTVIIREL